MNTIIMATLKFFKKATQPTTNVVAGSVWFNTTLKTIEVYNGTEWEKFAGKLTDANWNATAQKLTINKADGSSIDLDFSNIASLSGVQAALSSLQSTLEGQINEAKQAAATADGKAVAAQNAADAEAERADAAEKALGLRIDGVASDLATETANRQTEDGKLAGRISTLESTITGLNGTLHFRGVQDEEPTEPKQGDFYITTAGVEYIHDGTKWEKIGDTSAESASIAALEGRMTTAESGISTNAGAISALQTRASEIEAYNQSQDAEIAKKAVKTEVEASISGLQEQITGNDTDIKNLQDRCGEIETAASALAGRVSANETAISGKAAQSDLEGALTRITNVETKASNNETEIGKTNTALGNYKTEVSNTYATKVSLGETEDKAEQNKKDIAGHETRLATAEGTITNHGTRLSAAEGTINKLGETYVSKTDYASDKATQSQKDAGQDSRLEQVEGRATNLESAISRLDTEQGTQNESLNDHKSRIEALEGFKNGLDVGVTKVTGDSYITASPEKGDVKLTVNATTSVTSGSAALVTSGAVATAINNALTWEEFE